MFIPVKRSIRMAALSAVLALSGKAALADNTFKNSDGFTLASMPEANPSAERDKQPAQSVTPKYLADAPASPNIHGFLSVPFKSAYVTPRGLVVENAGVVFQPIIGLVFPIGDFGPLKDTAVVTGIWQSFNTAQDDPVVGCWNEVDYFLSFSGKVGDGFGFTLTYSPWFFPQSTVGKPDTEHNIDLKLTYSDKWIDGFSINPYVDLWWAVGGSSTVVLGDKGGTGYVELGIVPTKTVNMGVTPITFTFPTYVSVGPKGYWDTDGSHDGGHFGLFSISANASLPISAIPVQYGHWHLDVGVTYDYLINDALLDAGNILSGNDNRNVLVGSIGIGVNF